jgi:hypothetical protein
MRKFISCRGTGGRCRFEYGRRCALMHVRPSFCANLTLRTVEARRFSFEAPEIRSKTQNLTLEKRPKRIFGLFGEPNAGARDPASVWSRNLLELRALLRRGGSLYERALRGERGDPAALLCSPLTRSNIQHYCEPQTPDRGLGSTPRL